MFDMKVFLLLSFVAHIHCQRLLNGRQSPIDSLPGVGACDRIAARGVGNCMENFLPTNVLSSFTGGSRSGSGGDICCSYSKYKACINGLYAGLRIAMQRERCPKSYSTQIIKSLGDSSSVSPLKSFCGNGGKGSKCPKSGSTKPKNKKRQPSNAEDDSFVGGIGGAFQPVRDLFNGGTGSRERGDSSFLTPVRDVFSRGRETVEQGASSLFGGLQSGLAGLGDFGRRNN